ncbi:MAG: serine hydrolase domain-containing protein [Alphaproteobacteria bacterium]
MPRNARNGRRVLRLQMGSLLSVFLLLLAARAGADELAPTLDRLARAAVAEDGVTGIVIGIGRERETPMLVAAGLADVAEHAPMRRTSDFKVASIAKTFLAALTLSLAQEGKLALDDKLARFLPDVPNAERVSLKQLLNHTSGYDDFLTDAFVAAARAQPGKTWDPLALLAFAHPERLGFEPGSRFDYSDTDYLLLRMALETALGHSPIAEMRQRFIAPLGLSATWFASEETVPAGMLAHGYSDLDGSGSLQDATGEPDVLGGDDGAMVSNAADLLRWGQALYGGHVLAKPQLDEMLSFVTPSEEDSAPGSGYGLGVERFRYAGVMLYGHTGSVPGYNSILLYEPTTGTAIVLAVNSDPADDALLDILVERVIRALGDAGKLRLPKQPESG